MKLGSDSNGELTFLDVIALLSFLIGVENLEENISQSDLGEYSNRIMSEIHQHLEEQDKKLDHILGLLEEKNL